MTVEQLHDAIGMLPADLVAETDRLCRGRKPARRWQHYAAMAACCVLVLGCAVAAGSWRAGGAKETAADTAMPFQAVPAEGMPQNKLESRRQEQARCIPAQPDAAAGDMAPKACLVESAAQLAQCRREWADYYGSQALEEAFRDYDEDWFSQQVLVLMPVDGGEDLQVSRIEQQQEQWTIVLSGTPGSQHWLVLMQTPRGSVGQIGQVQVVFEPVQE